MAESQSHDDLSHRPKPVKLVLRKAVSFFKKPDCQGGRHGKHGQYRQMFRYGFTEM